VALNILSIIEMVVFVKLLRGTIAIDLSRMRRLSDQEVTGLLRTLIGLASEGYRVFISISPFNANIRTGRGRVYRASISYGAFILPPSTLGGFDEVYAKVCREVSGDVDLCWVLTEDVWADLDEIGPEISFDNNLPCPDTYIESVKELGYTPSERSRSRVACLEGGESVSIDHGRGYKYLLIPIVPISGYRSYTLERSSGFRHPIAVILSGRAVFCSDLQELELPEGAAPILNTVEGDTILYGLDTILYALACMPHPNGLLYRLAVLYTSLGGARLAQGGLARLP